LELERPFPKKFFPTKTRSIFPRFGFCFSYRIRCSLFHGEPGSWGLIFFPFDPQPTQLYLRRPKSQSSPSVKTPSPRHCLFLPPPLGCHFLPVIMMVRFLPHCQALNRKHNHAGLTAFPPLHSGIRAPRSHIVWWTMVVFCMAIFYRGTHLFPPLTCNFLFLVQFFPPSIKARGRHVFLPLFRHRGSPRKRLF